VTAEIVIAAAMGTHADEDVDEDGRDVNVSIDAICSLRLYRFGFGCIMIEFFRLDQKKISNLFFESSFSSVVRVDRVANGGKSRLFVFPNGINGSSMSCVKWRSNGEMTVKC
jgi:hypothetical protein